MPQLAAEGIHLVRPQEMSGAQERFLDEFFGRTLFAIRHAAGDRSGHPFPYLANRSLCLVVCLRTNSTSPLPHMHLAPVDLREEMLSSICREAERVHTGRTSRIVAKVNGRFDAAEL